MGESRGGGDLRGSGGVLVVGVKEWWESRGWWVEGGVKGVGVVE